MMLTCAVFLVFALLSGVPFGIRGAEATGVCQYPYSSVPGTDLCIQVVTRQKNWDKARKICKRSGGDLLTIHDQQTFDALKSSNLLPTRRTFWIGLNDKTAEGNYVWLDESSAASFHNLNQLPQFSRNASIKDCVIMMTSGSYQWYMQTCYSTMGFICSRNV